DVSSLPPRVIFNDEITPRSTLNRPSCAARIKNGKVYILSDNCFGKAIANKWHIGTIHFINTEYLSPYGDMNFKLQLMDFPYDAPSTIFGNTILPPFKKFSPRFIIPDNVDPEPKAASNALVTSV